MAVEDVVAAVEGVVVVAVAEGVAAEGKTGSVNLKLRISDLDG